jgi:hypothetical protein
VEHPPGADPPIVDAFTPTVAEIDEAIEILQAAQAAGGRRSATTTGCTTVPATATSGNCSSVRNCTSYSGSSQLPAEVRERWFGETGTQGP